jgi:phosphoribosylglycinamide formyltransferase 1
MKKIAIFASGSGSNARKILEFSAVNRAFEVELVVSNRADAGVLGIAKEFGVGALVVEREAFKNGQQLIEALSDLSVGHIVLAGFLWLVPKGLIQAFPERIVNIHPSLLPKFGGKGMHGMHVHAAVKAAGEHESGMTIHLVNEEYDKGRILFQAKCPVSPMDSPQDIAHKVLALEHRCYPHVIAAWVNETEMPNL